MVVPQAPSKRIFALRERITAPQPGQSYERHAYALKRLFLQE
jgi:hypothetical protein